MKVWFSGQAQRLLGGGEKRGGGAKGEAGVVVGGEGCERRRVRRTGQGRGKSSGVGEEWKAGWGGSWKRQGGQGRRKPGRKESGRERQGEMQAGEGETARKDEKERGRETEPVGQR